jgi:DNA-directed RNA polymerase beta' subunit
VITDTDRKYESRGFVASSFIGGMNPKEMFFHAMTGREGMINTAMGTANSGYIQRSCVKLNEDLKVAYDGTIRDANQNLYQYAYGNHGFDPSLVTFDAKGNPMPVMIERLSNRLSGNKPREPLRDDDIEQIVAACEWKCQIPRPIHDKMWGKHATLLREKLRAVTLWRERLPEFKNVIIEKYHTARATPGESVGIIGAQSIGELQTQTNLNTFHRAGELQNSGVGRFEELLSTSKNIKVKTCTLFFKRAYATAEEARRDVGCSIVGLRLSDVVEKNPIVTCDDTSAIVTFRYKLNKNAIYIHRVAPNVIINALEATGLYTATFDATSITITAQRNAVESDDADDDEEEADDDDTDNNNNTANGGPRQLSARCVSNAIELIENARSNLERTRICGIDGIKAMHFDNDGKEWYVVTEGSCLSKLLAHPLIDTPRVYCNDIWEVYDCLGIAAVRRMLFKDIKKVVRGVNDLHVQLQVDKMTFKGRPTSVTRYSMRTNDVGPLSKATFEEVTDVIVNAAVRTERETMSGVSAAIISGNHAKIGTGMMGLRIDYDSLAQISQYRSADEPVDAYY